MFPSSIRPLRFHGRATGWTLCKTRVRRCSYPQWLSITSTSRIVCICNQLHACSNFACRRTTVDNYMQYHAVHNRSSQAFSYFCLKKQDWLHKTQAQWPWPCISWSPAQLDTMRQSSLTPNPKPKCIAKQLFHIRFSMVYVPYCAEERLQSSSQHRTRHGEVHLCSACLAKSAANESPRGSERQHVPTENISLPRSSKMWITVDNCVTDTFPAPSQFESNLLKRACRLS